MPISSEAAKVRARIAGKKRQNPDADVTDDQRELKMTTLEDYVQRVIASAPLPTPEQIARLRALLPPVG
ncbi:hypothetical protein KN815_41300 [Streptomyces sp. 4503]|uniref:PhiRv1 phage protein n=1 Tax=Streptomyces niphimycinicus TaxID=2842201 RepID=A0ABS6CUA7_9ACTN|nr:hypothetical protein [Streptomyces niphimycinicus]MBU3870255.1 hypothetical protein [Streptomyces niphimycinicus]